MTRESPHTIAEQVVGGWTAVWGRYFSRHNQDDLIARIAAAIEADRAHVDQSQNETFPLEYDPT